MTNREKFEQVFNVKFTDYVTMFCAIAPDNICAAYHNCTDCPFNNWWNQEFKERTENKDKK